VRSRLATAAAALSLLAAVIPGAAAAVPGGPSAAPGGVSAVDEPTTIVCSSSVAAAPAAPGVHASVARALLRITGRPHVAGRRVSVDTDLATAGCLTLTLYPRGARRLDATTQIGTIVRAIADPGPTRSVIVLNARGRRMLKARHAIAAMLITDFRSPPDTSGAEVTLSTPVWL
jgi:hypothetical protein